MFGDACIITHGNDRFERKMKEAYAIFEAYPEKCVSDTSIAFSKHETDEIKSGLGVETHASSG